MKFGFQENYVFLMAILIIDFNEAVVKRTQVVIVKGNDVL